ncbi:MAG: hypothetical protein FJZ01_21465 [Candidatus Sericytochromatia bacterium]|nr:hypothetical protein [Candidatus Tanganyikabacteria bacterium]
MTDKELEQAGRELLILETLAKISALRQEIEGYERRYGSFEALQAKTSRTGEEDFDLDDACNAWRWAQEHLTSLEDRLKTLRSDAA